MMDQAEVCEESHRQQRRSCGRYIFREADLAYLLIDDEKMFPLAELLASLFNNTARTTLFTRMEKINTRRHFCNAQEIRLLKTVNGIHGSSAICTLIPEADVQKYCEVFIDRTVDLKLFSTRQRKTTRNDSSKTEDSKQVKGGNGLMTEETKSTITNNIESDYAAKSSKRKKASASQQKLNSKSKTKLSWEGKNTHKSNQSQLLDDCRNSLKVNQDARTALANHVLQETQTSHVVKPRKKRKFKEQECLSKDNQRRHKKAKISKTLKSNPRRHGNSDDDMGDNSCLADGSSNSRVGNLQKCSSSSLSQCLANASSEILFSDASSNDSGFASTTTSESVITSNPSACLEAKRGKKAHDNFAAFPSSSKHNKGKKLKKSNEECKPHSQSLSPPALVIKRQNNTWQVETKSTEKETDSRCIKTFPNKVKKRLKWTSCSSEFRHHDKKEKTSNSTVKKKKKRNITISDKDATNTIQVDSGRRNVTIGKRKRTKKNQRNNNDIQVNINDSTIKNSSLSKNSTSSAKRGKNSKDQSKQVTNSTRANTKKITVPRAKTLKANQNFKFMNLFSAFPMLSFKDGDLSPTYSEILPEKTNKPGQSHPIWKWQSGRPIYIPENKKTYRIR